ncbi:sulfite exporter TauE/SafE family protein [Roseobacteraceae bacterium S113]
MPDLLAQALAMPGLGWVLLITAIAGVVYGFAGFGAALIFMPVATRFVPVEVAVGAFAISALSSLVTVVPRAWGQAEKPAVLLMIAASAITTSLGLYVLRTTDVTIMRWAVLAVVSITLLALISGWRIAAHPSTPARGAIGGAAGFVGGATGLAGPVMVLFQLASPDGVARSRANTLCFLTLSSLVMLPLMVAQGMLPAAVIVVGLIMMVPYGLGARLGQALFDPSRESLYRKVAYGIIGAAVLMGLPVWE